MVFRPKCKVCGHHCASIEVIAPYEHPMEWASWDQRRQSLFRKHRASASHYLLYEGPVGGNGWVGDAITEARATLIIAAFAATPTPDKMQSTGICDGAGFCAECGEFYCPKHWSISETGYGVCPNGHGKSLDPHWHPCTGK